MKFINAILHLQRIVIVITETDMESVFQLCVSVLSNSSDLETKKHYQ